MSISASGLEYELTTDFLSSFFPPFPRWARSELRLASPPVYCQECEQPLIEIPFSKHSALACDNIKCRLFRQRQVIRERESQVELKNCVVIIPVSSKGGGW